ncbi:MAG: hypothetical protein CMM46_04500 [Rhodospirillaceae bacterium]|nr:hypothetical protein [Rhodospirillaceae bacterium]
MLLFLPPLCGKSLSRMRSGIGMGGMRHSRIEARSFESCGKPFELPPFLTLPHAGGGKFR